MPVKISIGTVYRLRNGLRARIKDIRHFKFAIDRPPFHAYVGEILSGDGRILRREAQWELSGRYSRAAETDLDILGPVA